MENLSISKDVSKAELETFFRQGNVISCKVVEVGYFRVLCAVLVDGRQRAFYVHKFPLSLQQNTVGLQGPLAEFVPNPNLASDEVSRRVWVNSLVAKDGEGAFDPDGNAFHKGPLEPASYGLDGNLRLGDEVVMCVGEDGGHQTFVRILSVNGAEVLQVDKNGKPKPEAAATSTITGQHVVDKPQLCVKDGVVYVLMMLRGNAGDFQSAWCLAGGGFVNGAIAKAIQESEKEAADREGKEEIGLVLGGKPIELGTFVITTQSDTRNMPLKVLVDGGLLDVGMSSGPRKNVVFPSLLPEGIATVFGQRTGEAGEVAGIYWMPAADVLSLSLNPTDSGYLCFAGHKEIVCKSLELLNEYLATQAVHDLSERVKLV
jgi:ADP-ribose pyrophosphatase YjhB (NUDIX family)